MKIENYKPNDIYISNEFYNIKSDILEIYKDFTDLGNEISLNFNGFIITLDNLLRLSIYSINQKKEVNSIINTIEKIIKKYFKKFQFQNKLH